MTYEGHRGGVITLIHNKYVYSNNLFESPTHATISSFLQIIRIANELLQLWLLVNLYMSSHKENIMLIPTYILYGDFNQIKWFNW